MTTTEIQQIRSLRDALTTVKEKMGMGDYASISVSLKARNGVITSLAAYHRLPSEPRRLFDIAEIEQPALFGCLFTMNFYEDTNTEFREDVNDVLNNIDKVYGRVLMVDEILADLA